MRKTICFFIINLLISNIIFSQSTIIPDANFEQALIDLGYDTGTPDGVVYTDSINTITHLDVSCLQISDLTGIEDFTSLSVLECYYNSLMSLDLTNNTALTELWCYGNKITNIDIRNGNNIFLKRVMTFDNPDLLCIAVDDLQYSILNWVGSFYWKDDWTDYTSYLCGHNLMTGMVYFDENNNCIRDPNEQGLKNVLVKVDEVNEMYAITDDDGSYNLWIEPYVNYEVSVSYYIPNMLEGYCPDGGYSIFSGPDGTKTSDIDFGMQLKDCAMLSVDVSKAVMRRCFRSPTTVTYKNEGSFYQENAELFIDFPEYVKIISASESYIEVDAAEGIYKFNIDTIHAFSEGKISIIDSVICYNDSIMGFTQCIKAWIAPKLYCAETKDTAEWDKSSIEVLSYAECIGDTVVRFKIYNNGSGDMFSPHEYRLYYNNELTHTGSFQLLSGDTMIVDATADGSTIRLEADQHTLHPGNSQPRITIEGCGEMYLASLGFWSQAPNDDLDYDVSENCLEITGSFDPNDKKVSPRGITENHYVPEKGSLKYTIRFQNTGTDTAFKVVVIDTLSNQLDMTTFNVNGASHNFEYEITGKTNAVLSFIFKDIKLPDSTTDEPGSNGFLSFTISSIENITPRTRIENYADIYFDYNSAIRTDTAFVIALDTTISSDKTISVKEILAIKDIIENDFSNISIYPNPSNNYLIVEDADISFNQLKLYDVMGRLLINQTIISNQQKVDVQALNHGIYFIHLTNNKGEKYTFKVVKE